MKVLALRTWLPALDVRAWLRTFAVTGGMQVLVQALAFAGGLLVVRLLAPREYAYFTIAQTVLGAATVISDAGVSSGVLASGGRVWQDPAALGRVLATGHAVRRRLAACVAAVAMPTTFLMVLHQGASPTVALLLALATLPPLFATAATNILEVALRLRQDLLALQRTQALLQASRAASFLLTLVAWPFAALAVLVPVLPQWWSNARLRARVATHADPAAEPDPAVRAELHRQIARSAPIAVYYAISGQLAVFLLTLFASAEEVAAAGALGRLAMILAAVGGVFTLTVVPRFARLSDTEPSRLASRYWLAQLAFAAVCAIPVAAIALAPGPVLALLGPDYAHLQSEAVLAATGAAASSLAGLAFVLGSARGTLVPPLFAVPFCIAVQAALAALLPVGTVAGVLWLGLLTAAAQWAMHAGYFVLRGRRSGGTT